MTNDLPTHSVIPSTKSISSGYPIFNSHLFFLQKSRSEKASNCFGKTS